MLELKLIAVLAAVISGVSQAAALTIDVYVESQCKFSWRFLREQIAPNYERIRQDVSLTIVPFGKSRSVTNASGVFFECQHGSFECATNMFQSCALSLMDDMDRRTQFMVCSMRRRASQLNCAASVGLTARAVNECVDSGRGIELQLHDEAVTAPIIALSGHVPTVVFNGHYDLSDDLNSQADLLEVVTDKLKNPE